MICLGCGNFGGIGSAPAFFGRGAGEQEARAIMDAAWAAGIHWFGTADAYGGGASESFIGRWQADRAPEGLAVATKVFNPLHEGGDRGLSRDRILRGVEGSLARLGVDRIDYYLAHDRDVETPLAETVAAFEELVADGLVGAWGLSNHDAAAVREALELGRPALVQNAHYRLLPVAECIEPMQQVLAALARDEVHNPLRFVIRPPDAGTLMGLMPAHQSAPAPVYSLKAVCIIPGNAARGLDSHQGFVALFDGETGQTRALVNAGAITAVRTAAVSAVATQFLPRPDSSTLAILGSGTQGRSHLEAMRAVLPIERVRVWSRTPGHASRLDGVEAVATPEEAVRGADVVVTATSSPEPSCIATGSPRARTSTLSVPASRRPASSTPRRWPPPRCTSTGGSRRRTSPATASAGELAGGVVTASAGSMAQGAYAARLRGVPATIVVPEGAPQTKVAAVERFGGRVVALPYDDWWRVLVEGHYDGADGLFVYPVDNREVMAGNGTIGLELLEDLPDLDAVIVPYGGGGSPHRHRQRREGVAAGGARLFGGAATGASAADALAGGPGEVEYTRSWVDGAGSRSIIPAVWEHVSGLIDGAAVVSLAEAGKAGSGKVVAIVSGGNIDPAVFSRILAGESS